MQQQRSPKINFREIFRVVRFSTFATISARNGHADAVAACPLLRDELTWLGGGPRSEFDPNATMDAWKDGGAPRCQAGLECLTPSAQLMLAGPPLLMWNNVGTLALGALAEGSSSQGSHIRF